MFDCTCGEHVVNMRWLNVKKCSKNIDFCLKKSGSDGYRYPSDTRMPYPLSVHGYGYGYKKIEKRIRIRIRKSQKTDTDTDTDTKNLKNGYGYENFRFEYYYSNGQLFYQTKKLKKVYTSVGTDMIWLSRFSNMIYNLLLNNNPLSWSELSFLKRGGCYLATFWNDENIDIFIKNILKYPLKMQQ